MEPLRIPLTIIMPVFNHRDEVRTMIDSIRANDFCGWELLAIDDGSRKTRCSCFIIMLRWTVGYKW